MLGLDMAECTTYATINPYEDRPITILPADLSLLTINAVRWALQDRPIYTVVDTIDVLGRVWQYLGTEQRDLIRHDVRRAIARADAAAVPRLEEIWSSPQQLDED